MKGAIRHFGGHPVSMIGRATSDKGGGTIRHFGTPYPDYPMRVTSGSPDTITKNPPTPSRHIDDFLPVVIIFLNIHATGG
jgi:hypothetical protein